MVLYECPVKACDGSIRLSARAHRNKSESERVSFLVPRYISTEDRSKAGKQISQILVAERWRQAIHEKVHVSLHGDGRPTGGGGRPSGQATWHRRYWDSSHHRYISIFLSIK